MTVKIEATRTNHERWSGKLTGEQVHALLLKGLQEELCPHHRYGVTLELRAGIVRSGDALGELNFELVYDRDWTMKPPTELPTASVKVGDCGCSSQSWCNSLACPRRPTEV